MAGSAPSNSEAVDFEKQQAAEADAKEAARQQRLTQGQQLIDQIFNGSPVMASTPFDWSKFNPQTNSQELQYEAAGGDLSKPHAEAYTDPSLPAGYTIRKVGGASGAGGASDPFAGFPGARAPNANFGGLPSAKGPAGSGPFAGFPTAGAGGSPASAAALKAFGLDPSTAGGAGGYQIVGPDGKVYNQGDQFDIQTPTGKTSGGFDDAFYNAYKQKVLDYYQPDEQRQYDEAKRDLTFNLARSGNLYSSTAADKTGELGYQDALQKANIVANANAQEGQLKNQIQSNKESLINQLYATEDPTLTANLAESSANATKLQDPQLTPAASLFSPAVSAVGSAVQSLMYPNQYASSLGGQATSPTPASSLGTGGSSRLSRGVG
jgi:hypothetical protein